MQLTHHIRQLVMLGLSIALLATLCACRPTPTPTPLATATDAPTVTPAHTATPIPTRAGPTVSIPTPIPTEDRDYNLCVNIVSDSNGFGHVTFFVPEIDRVAITYITPLWVPLRAHLDAVGLTYLEVLDRSLSAGGLTIASSNYLDSHQYFEIRNEDCKFVIITPFIPDVSVNLSRPEDYVTNLEYMVRALHQDGSESRVLVLNYYDTYRAEFTADNSGWGQTPERLAAFNEALAAACATDGVLRQYSQVICVNTQSFFSGMGRSYILGETNIEDYESSLYRTNSYSELIDEYFAAHPDGEIIGDGIHLSQAGRDRLAERLAEMLFYLNDDF